MKNTFKRLLIAGCCLYTVITILGMISGCATANPKAGQPIIDPVTGHTNGVEPATIPNATGTKIVSYANQAVPLIPAPYGDLAALVLAGSTVVMKLISDSKNKQLTAVVQGVEDGTSAATVTADTVKKAIQARATASGVQTKLDATVQKLT